ncbi:MAG: ribonuclease Z [Spirochaetia bacterium]|nr:ribonuclease Z [Spirochaetia bacterium]MDD6654124.1 ribonuclease Z [Treponema sp.]MCI5608833.1 ribonuclease Z [Spirochaetia bacterium]MCI6827416.1 ribonuclease Z [Spirochaetia bacterium]MCI7564824.1 ribonuclease Z [Spirochaetia bacterium]
MNMEAFILGCGGMMPLPYRHLTSVLLRRDGDLFLFDGGEGTQVSLRRLNLKWKKINAIFVSHTHADHVTGLPGILMLNAQVERTEPLFIFGPPKIKEYIETSRKVLDMYINYPIEVKEITAPSIVFEGDGFYIRAFPLDHTKTCVGYTLEELDRPGEFNPEKAELLNVPVGPLWGKLQKGQPVVSSDGKTVFPEDVMGKKRSGRKFSFVTDTLYKTSIAKEVYGSDLLVCEAMFENDLIDQAKEKKHMTAREAALIARDSNSLRMYMIHYSPRYNDKELEKLLLQAREIYPGAELSKDRMCIDIPYVD